MGLYPLSWCLLPGHVISLVLGHDSMGVIGPSKAGREEEIFLVFQEGDQGTLERVTGILALLSLFPETNGECFHCATCSHSTTTPLRGLKVMPGLWINTSKC